MTIKTNAKLKQYLLYQYFFEAKTSIFSFEQMEKEEGDTLKFEWDYLT